MSSTVATGWLSLVISLPGRRGTARMRVWRALKAAGAAVLRDGVYLLPAGDRMHQVFMDQAQAVRAAGGSAWVLGIDVDRGQGREFQALFDRGPEYAHWLDKVQKLQGQLRRRRLPDVVRRVQGLKRELEALRATDHFPGPAAEQADEAQRELEAAVMAHVTPGEPHGRTGVIEKRAPAQYRGRTWATRARPWVDRLASAWLIKRFIDPKARILWLKDIKRCPKLALGFDFDGATFSHVGARVTFEHLLASFGLEQDAALMRIGRMVHCLDVGGAPVPEAQGLAAILAGARARLSNDNRLLAEASRVFDHLYRSCQEK
jgi:hypothetical protein